ncbi:hypothetical protein A3K63_00480 [Candidatus Micrarchaeota archaeon RBG_16_49_10]|nr:MAG: hypothetical protein A3K63_00480 [Candidatus Micrarchaeota archaeon RBG_16_49_10]
MKRLLLNKRGSYLVNFFEGVLRIADGEIPLKELEKKNPGEKIKTHKGVEFTVVEPSSIDLMGKMKRAAQIITSKDASLILGQTGIASDSLIIDVGSGSGFLAIFLAKYCDKGKVITYERSSDFVDIVKKNVDFMGLKNVVVKERDVLKKFFDEKAADLVTLDMMGAEKIVKKCHKILKPGGWLVIYSPHIEQVGKVSVEIENNDFTQVRTIECIIREWKSDHGYTRPKTKGLMHTGWLTFARKI